MGHAVIPCSTVELLLFTFGTQRAPREIRMTTVSSKEEGRIAIRDLVNKYEANLEYFKSAKYDETSTRTHFIDKLFEALGWDVSNPTPEREVIFHNRHKIEPAVAGDEDWDNDLSQEELDARTTRIEVPDYAFFVSEELQFYVEAKRPHTGIRGKAATFQIKSYAWNQGLPFSVITDFDQLRVFHTSHRPDRDNPRAGLMTDFDLSYKDYGDGWDHLWSLLSREAVTEGKAAKLALQRTPRGATEVREEFLRDLGQWREELGNDLLRRHSDLEIYQLEEATQRILDRLIFVRVVEDRRLEPAFILRRYARISNSYRHLCYEFRRLDNYYNGQLFAEHYSERLEVTDGLIQRIIASLYAVDGSPYRFDTFHADFLGQVYERFLGAEFDRSGSTVKLKVKPEVRHAGGVYYTPRWVVNHMVKSALDPILEGMTPTQVSRLRIVDPACGSGTFLLGVLDRLIRWHEEYYNANPDEDLTSHYLGPDGCRHLTTDRKGQIIVNNVYGVDIDPQAVEVAQMSLYLRILENETEATLAAQPRLFEGARLPSLARNVRTGNSLICESDVPHSLIHNHDLIRRINPFDWKDSSRGFGEIFVANGGFDVVIGNPPYTRVQALRRSRPEETAIVEKRYVTATAGFDIASLFTERGLAILKPSALHQRGGTLVYITSRTFTETDAGLTVRRLLADGRHVAEVIDFRSGRVFAGASAYTVILKLTAKPTKTWKLTRVPEPPSEQQLAHALRDRLLTAEVPTDQLSSEPWTLSLPAEDQLLRRLSVEYPSLRKVSGNSIFQGIITGQDSVFRAVDVGPDPNDPYRRLVRPRSANLDDLYAFELAVLKPIYAGRTDFRPFWSAPSTEWLIFPYDISDRNGQDRRVPLAPWDKFMENAPNVALWLKSNEKVLRDRNGHWSDLNWHGYSRPQNLERFAKPKIMVPSMIDQLCGHFDTDGHYFVNVSTGGYGIGNDMTLGVDFEYVAALLNSTLLSWILRRFSRAWRGGWFEARKGNLQRLPIVVPSADRQREVINSYRNVRDAVAAAARFSDESRVKLAATAQEYFNHVVFSLYGLSFKEITLIQQ